MLGPCSQHPLMIIHDVLHYLLSCSKNYSNSTRSAASRIRDTSMYDPRKMTFTDYRYTRRVPRNKKLKSENNTEENIQQKHTKQSQYSVAYGYRAFDSVVLSVFQFFSTKLILYSVVLHCYAFTLSRWPRAYHEELPCPGGRQKRSQTY